jgi:hypothetical protein
MNDGARTWSWQSTQWRAVLHWKTKRGSRGSSVSPVNVIVPWHAISYHKHETKRPDVRRIIKFIRIHIKAYNVTTAIDCYTLCVPRVTIQRQLISQGCTAQIFQKSRSHIEITGARRATRSKLLTQDPPLGATDKQYSRQSEMAPPCSSGSTYICERFSSKMNSVTNTHKNWLNDERLNSRLRVRIA